MESKKSLLERFCNWLGTHLPYRAWEHNGEHAYCRICHQLLDKINGKWLTWDKNPNNPASN